MNGEESENEQEVEEPESVEGVFEVDREEVREIKNSELDRKEKKVLDDLEDEIRFHTQDKPYGVLIIIWIAVIVALYLVLGG